MLNEIYNKRILELAADIPRLGRLPAPDGSATLGHRAVGWIAASGRPRRAGAGRGHLRATPPAS